jgi:hypothetical protein
MIKLPDYRLRITQVPNHHTYLTRVNGSVSYFNGSMTPLALSNLVDELAAETTFKLKDAPDGGRAAVALRDTLRTIWHGNPRSAPTVEVL